MKAKEVTQFAIIPHMALLLCFDPNILNILCRFQVTADIGAFDELIHCCHRLVDLKRKDLDIEVQNSTMLVFICL